ncbi:hypothetical protein Fmac_019230 [Flemingia macrophylla]|uniref:Uncharacterized protein n=1 Tax=Flemingia macrophylla TaxID=520843 RepID=A0ABD1M779_9FABA
MEGTVTFTLDQINRQNIPPLCNNSKKKKNPISLISPSFKRKVKRVPLADITNLFNNSAHEQNGISALASASLSSVSSSPRRTLLLLGGSKTLRMAFR